MHHIYQTEGIVLGSFPAGESNRCLYLFTRECGLVLAHAQSVRSIASKLRFSLQDLSIAHVSLVRGRHIWRVINAAHNTCLYSEFSSDPGSLEVCVNTIRLLKRLVTGEEKNDRLFSAVSGGLNFLKESRLIGAELKAFECVLVLRILSVLGYTGSSVLEPLYSGDLWSRELVSGMVPSIDRAVSEINHSLKATHL